MRTSLLTGIALLAALVGAIPAKAAQPLAFQTDICGPHIALSERRLGIPRHLLKAIAQAESGRWDDERAATIAWPWTVTSGGPGKYFPSKAAAIAEVRRLQAEGVTNIDVGCMQINLHYHPDAFRDIEAAFDPGRNVAYAGSFLRRLFESTGSWGEAAQRYHSNDPDRGARYREKVMAGWRLARGEPNDPDASPDTPDRETIQAAAEPAAPAEQSREHTLMPPPVWTRDRIAALNDRFRSRLVETRGTAPAKTAAHEGRPSTGRSVSDARDFAAKRQAQLAKWRQNRRRF